MKKLNCILIFLFFFSNSFSQIYESYNFENLTFGNIDTQDNWVVYSSFSSLTNSNVCPASQSTIINAEILNTQNLGSYNNQKGIVFNGYNQDQSATASRKNDQNWATPSLSNQKYLFLDFIFGNTQQYKELRLAYDKNNDGDFAADCSKPDTNELGIGIRIEESVFGFYNLNLYSNSYAPIATAPLPNNNTTEYRIFVDFEANNNQGSISVFYKALGFSEIWQAIPSLQNVYAGFVTNGENPSNPANLEGLYISNGIGLNSFVDNIEFQTISKNNNLEVCSGDSTNISYNIDGVNYVWSDNSTNSSNFLSNEVNQQVDINFNNFLSITDSFTLNIIPFGNADLGPNRSICIGDIELLTLENTLNVAYLWQDNSNLNNFLVTDTGFYSVEVNYLGCYSYDTIYINNAPMPYIDLGNDTLICKDEVNLILTAETNGTIFKWQDGSISESYNVINEGLYILEVKLDQCVARDSIIIRTRERIRLGNDTTICEGQPLFLVVDTIYDDYVWFDGFKEPIKVANYPSRQWLSASIGECRFFSDTITIIVNPFPVITSIFNDTLICEDQPINLNVSGLNYESILWHDFSQDTNTSVIGSGDYFVMLTNYCGSTSDTISVLTENCNCSAFIPSAFSPNKDLLNEYYQYQFNCEVFRFNHKIFNKWGNIIFETKDQDIKWDGRCNNTICPTGVYLSKFEFFYKNAREKTLITRRITLNQ